jgi:hypothetical protein
MCAAVVSTEVSDAKDDDDDGIDISCYLVSYPIALRFAPRNRK